MLRCSIQFWHATRPSATYFYWAAGAKTPFLQFPPLTSTCEGEKQSFAVLYYLIIHSNWVRFPDYLQNYFDRQSYWNTAVYSKTCQRLRHKQILVGFSWLTCNNWLVSWNKVVFMHILALKGSEKITWLLFLKKQIR